MVQHGLLAELEGLVAAHDWHGVVALKRETLALATALRGVDPSEAEFIHSALGYGYQFLGQYGCAITQYREAKAVSEELGDRSGVANACCNIGSCFKEVGEFEQAIAFHLQHRAISEELGDRVGVVNAGGNLAICYMRTGKYEQAIVLHEECKAMAEERQDRAWVAKACGNLGSCYMHTGKYEQALVMHEQDRAISGELGDRMGVAKACGNLGICYSNTGDYGRAQALFEQHKAMAEELGATDEVGIACNNLGAAFAKMGDLPAAAHTLVQGLAAWQRVEREVGEHDSRRVSLFEKQQEIYMHLQSVLLGLEEPGWALAVAAQAKARALAHRLGVGICDRSVSNDDADAGAAHNACHGAYTEVCGMWWAEVQQQARGEAAAAAGQSICTLEYSLLLDDRLAIWVLSGAGELLGSATVPTTGLGGTAGRSVGDLLQEVRGSMKVRGRDAMAGRDREDFETSDLRADLPDSGSSERGKVCKVCQCKPCTCKADMAREDVLLRELYATLVAPVEAALDGADEVLIVPHVWLFEVPWSALIDARGRFLIERCVLRVAPSLRVAHQAANIVRQHAGDTCGHVVLVGNPLPIPPQFCSLPSAEQEAQGVHDILNMAGVEVHKKHFFRSDLNPKATKANVKKSLQGAGWVHFACHADMDANSLVLAIPDSDPVPEIQ